MYFENLHDLWHMAGHGPYVWGAYGVTLVVLVLLLRSPLARHRRTLRRIARQQQFTQSGSEKT